MRGETLGWKRISQSKSKGKRRGSDPSCGSGCADVSGSNHSTDEIVSYGIRLPSGSLDVITGGEFRDEIVVIGRRSRGSVVVSPAVAFPGFGWAFGFGHFYEVESIVCASGNNLSDEQVAELFASAIAPSAIPIAAQDGGTYLVTDPTSGLLSGLPGGYVVTTIAPDGLSGRNTTTAAHSLFWGTVDRSVFRTSTGAIGVRTHGTGSNLYFSPVMALANALHGPEVFAAVDRQFAASLSRADARCSGN